jgi:hypothetical protein
MVAQRSTLLIALTLVTLTAHAQSEKKSFWNRFRRRKDTDEVPAAPQTYPDPNNTVGPVYAPPSAYPSRQQQQQQQQPPRYQQVDAYGRPIYAPPPPSPNLPSQQYQQQLYPQQQQQLEQQRQQQEQLRQEQWRQQQLREQAQEQERIRQEQERIQHEQEQERNRRDQEQERLRRDQQQEQLQQQQLQPPLQPVAPPPPNPAPAVPPQPLLDVNAGAPSVEQSRRWAFLNLNDQPEEVMTAKELAGPGNIVVFTTSTSFEKYLVAHPEENFSTIVISGHSTGVQFISGGGVSADKVAQWAAKYPGVRSVDTLYALGCYTAITSNALAWSKGLPNIRTIAGFGLQAPSDEKPQPGQTHSPFAPSSAFLRQVERARRTLPESPTLEDVKRIMKPASQKWNQTYLASGVGVFDPATKAMMMTSVFESDLIVHDPLVICRDASRKIVDLLGTKFPALQDRTLDGLMAFYRWSSPSDPYVELPKDGPFTNPRIVYAHLQRLRGCPDSFFATDPNVLQVFGPNATGASLVKKINQTIAIVHGNIIADDYLICAPDFWNAIADRLERCGLTSGDVIARLRNRTPPFRATIWAAASAYRNGIEAQRAEGFAPSAVDSDAARYLTVLVNADGVPSDMWEVVESSGDPVCKSVSAHAKAKQLAAAACVKAAAPAPGESPAPLPPTPTSTPTEPHANLQQ